MAKRFKQARLWEHVRSNPGGARRDIAAALGWDPHATDRMLCKLLVKGSVRRVGRKHTARWFATAIEPTDWRGMAAGSATGRKIGATRAHIEHATRMRLQMQAAGTLKFTRHRWARAPAADSMLAGRTMLEQCWPMQSLAFRN